MSVNDVLLDAVPQRVWDTIVDPTTYPRWLEGAKAIRRVDPTWPAKGSMFHHSVGAGPLQLKDSTTVMEADAPSRLVLHVRARPFITALVTFTLEPAAGGGTHLRIEEQPTRTLIGRVTGPLVQLPISARNEKSLSNLKHLLEEGRSPKEERPSPLS